MKIVQDTEMFSFSLDSVLLPHFVTINKNINKILDIGCGNAPIPLILSTKTSCDIVGVEIQKDVYDMAMESVKLNNLDNQITIINDDINEYYKSLETDSFDIITCNPPFFKYLETSNINKNDYKTIARHEVKLNLNNIFTIARIRFVYPKKNCEANILLIEGSKNGKPGIKILPPLFTHLDNGEYSIEVKKYFE